MYQVGQKVVYGVHGVCSVLDIELRSVDRKKVEYYVLAPVKQPGSRFYVPTQNQAAVAKLHRLLTREELDALLSGKDIRQNVWIEDENKRKQYYRQIINSADRIALLQMVCCLHTHKQNQIKQGRKFHMCDETFLKDAQKLLESEFALVLNTSEEEVGKYLMQHFESV